MSRTPISAFLSGLLLLIQQAPTHGETLSLAARRLQLQGRQVQAEGGVRLQLGRCVLRANGLRLIPGGEVLAQQAWLVVGRISLTAHRLNIHPEALDADWVRGSFCTCPGSLPLLSLSARRGWVSPGGQRLHLQWPTLRVGNQTLIKWPYWFLPLAPGVSGLLAPQISWSAKDGARWEQGVYWAVGTGQDLRLSAGWFHGRGPRGHLRWRYFTEEHGDGELSMSGLEDRGWSRGAIQGNLLVKGQDWSAGVVPDLVSDGEQPAQLDHVTDRIFSPYLRSRLWARAGGETLVGVVTGDLFTELSTPMRKDRTIHGQWGANLGLMPIHLGGHISLLANLDVSHWSDGGAYFPVQRGVQRDEYQLEVSQLRFRPVLTLARRLSLLRVSGKAAYFYAGTWIPQVQSTGQSLISIQGGSLNLEGAMPLERIFAINHRRILHWLEPLISWDWSGSDAPGFLMPDGSMLWTGQRVMMGLRTLVMSRVDQGPVSKWGHAQALLELPFAWPNATPSELTAAVNGEFSLGPPHGMQVLSEFRYLPSEARLTKVDLRGCGQWEGLRPCVGYLHARLDNLVDSTTDASAMAGYTPDGMSILPLTAQFDQITGDLSWQWSSFSGDLRVAVDPMVPRLTQISYSIEWILGCGCYQLEFQGSSWAGTDNHHLMLGLRLLPGAGLGCNKVNNL